MISQVRAVLEQVNRHSQEFSVEVKFLPSEILIAFAYNQDDVWLRAVVIRDHVEYCLERINGELKLVEWGKDDV